MKSSAIQVLSLIVAVSVPAIADDATGTGSYRSDLWKMEFHQQEDEQSEDDVPDNDEHSAGEPSIDPGLSVAIDKLVANSVVGVNDSAAFISDAESTVSADVAESSFSGGISRTLSFRRSESTMTLSAMDPKDATPVSNGPSLLTLFVALVADVVITSAMFSGKR